MTVLLKLLGVAKWAWRLIAGTHAWFFEKPIRAVLLLFAIHVAVHQFAIDPGLRGQRDTAIAERDASILAHARTILSYRRAASRAAEEDAANKRHVQTEQTRISQEVANDFETKLADARARAAGLAEQLRDRASRTDPGGGTAAPVPSVPAAAGRAAQTSEQDRLSAAGEFALAERLTATEQALQLDSLIDWVERQAAVDVEGSR